MMYNWLAGVLFLEFMLFNLESEFLSLFVHGFKTAESLKNLIVANLELREQPIRDDVKSAELGRARLSISRSSLRIRQKVQKPRTQIYMDLNYIDPQARVLNYCFK